MTRFAPIALTGIAIVGVLIAAVTVAVISDGDGPPDDVADVPDEPLPSPTPTATPTPGGGGGTGGGGGGSTGGTQAPEPELGGAADRDGAAGREGAADGNGDGAGAGTGPSDDRASPDADTDSDVDAGSDADRGLADRNRGPRNGDADSDREIAGRQPRTGPLPNTGGVPGPLALAALAAGVTLGGIRLATGRAGH